jgi:hypothetical protein
MEDGMDEKRLHELQNHIFDLLADGYTSRDLLDYMLAALSTRCDDAVFDVSAVALAGLAEIEEKAALREAARQKH